jgi:DNA modification methylase
MVTCDQLGRICYGMEVDPVYCHNTIDRMIQLRPDIKITRNGKPYHLPAQKKAPK